MSKTAIVPDGLNEAMYEAIEFGTNGDLLCPHCDALYPISQEDACHIYRVAMDARPSVPDELIEEAAKAVLVAHMGGQPHRSWEEIEEVTREYYRSMARAAARVFNGGKDE